MSTHSTASTHEEKPHAINSIANKPISEALKRRAQSLIKDESIDAGGRTWIRYALEINDPMLSELVRRADAGESIIEDSACRRFQPAKIDSRQTRAETENASNETRQTLPGAS